MKQIISTTLKILVPVSVPVLIISLDLGKDTWKLVFQEFFLSALQGPYDVTVLTIVVISVLLMLVVSAILVFYVVIALKAIRERKAGTSGKLYFFIYLVSIIIIVPIVGFRLFYELSPKRFRWQADYTSEIRTYTYKKSGLYCESFGGILGLYEYAYGIYSLKDNIITRRQLYPPSFEKQQSYLWDGWSFTREIISEGNKKVVKIGDLQENLIFYDPKDTILLEGLNRFYWENGQLQKEYHIKNGKPHGLWREWYKNGQLHSHSKYDNGVLIDTSFNYHQNGRVMGYSVMNKGQVIARKYFDESGRLRGEFCALDSINANTVSYYPEGSIKSDNFIRINKYVGTEYHYYRNGNLKIIGKYRSGARDGVWLMLDSLTGKIIDTDTVYYKKGTSLKNSWR